MTLSPGLRVLLPLLTWTIGLSLSVFVLFLGATLVVAYSHFGFEGVMWTLGF